MARIARAGVACPVPLLVRLARSSSERGRSLLGAATATEASATVLRVDGVNGGVYFARVVSFLPGTVLAQCAGPPPAVAGAGALRRVGAAVACVGAALCAEDRRGSGGGSGEGGSGSPWDPAAARRPLTWDLGNALACASGLVHVTERGQRALAEKWLGRFCRALQPIATAATGEIAAGDGGDGGCAFAGLLVGLPEQVIHGDLNDYNVMLTQEAAMSVDVAGGVFSVHPEGNAATAAILASGVAVLDLGDMVWSKRVFDLAIAIAYAAQRRPSAEDALSAALAVGKGFANAQRVLAAEAATGGFKGGGGGRLCAAEALAVPLCVAARLCQSVLTSATTLATIRAQAAAAAAVVLLEGKSSTKDEAQAEAQEAYVLVSAAPGWALLQQWDELHDAGRLKALTNCLLE